MAKKNDITEDIKSKNVIMSLLLIVLVIICSMIISILTKVPKSNEITWGNLSNLGLVTEDKDAVFYNKYNQGIYKVKNKKEEQITDELAYSMQIKDDWIYYLTTTGDSYSYIKMIKTNGKDQTILKRISTSLNKFYIDGDYLYYTSNLSNTGIVKLNLNTREEINIAKGNIKDFSLVNGIMYFSDDLGGLYSVKEDGTDSKIILSNIDITEFQIYKDTVYYYNQGEDNLMYYKLGTEIAPSMISSQVTSYNFNIYNNRIYFYDSLDKKIKSCDLDGKSVKEIVDLRANSTRINLTKDGVLYYLDTRKGSTQFQINRIMVNGMNTDLIEY